MSDVVLGVAILSFNQNIQARIAQLVAHRLGTWEVPGSNPGKGENFFSENK